MKTIENFIKKESSAGVLLIIVTILALLLQNSLLSSFYNSFLHTPVEIRFGNLQIAKPLLLWVNDGLMAIFFFLIGLEVKREIMEGHLSSISKISLPAISALGGMVVPALVFIAFNKGESFAMNGWAIPTATDIAFALGIMLGLFIGKQLGVFGFSWVAIKMGWAKLPQDSSWLQLYGVAVLTGIGFTMSLFVDSLAYNDTQIYHFADKLAILIGSFASGIVGYLILRNIKTK